ncbi:MAG: hypothetical protein ACI8WB_003245 [Phenylobacterium sp.]|jgi:hypothetical protein
MHIVIYQWHTRDNFLLQNLFPHAQIIKAQPQADDQRLIDMARQIAAQHPNQPLHWFFQLNLSYSEHWLNQRSHLLSVLSTLGFTVYNGQVTDTRKRYVQQLNQQLGLNCVTIEQSQQLKDSLLVMVKSNYNYGGEFESQLSPEQLIALDLRSNIGCDIQGFDSYYQTTMAAVDKTLFDDERVVIERYIENLDQRFYRMYRCGNHAILSEIVNPDVVKKMRPGLPRKNWYFAFDQCKHHAYQALINDASLMFNAIKMNFGAIDIVMDDEDNGYIIDINPTPGWGSENQSKVLDFLRHGIEPVRTADAALL